MKKNQPPAQVIPLIGKDELNLCECPLTLLTDRQEKEQNILKFTDKQRNVIRHWKIVGSAEYGLPCAYDEPVYVAMLALTKEDGFKNHKIYFNPYEMLEIMKWSIGGQQYKRLKLAFQRLVGVTIYADYLWDNGNFKQQGEIGFHILDEFLIAKGKKDDKNSYFEWSKKVFESFLNGNLKNLNLDVYFSLSTAISRRFFRFWSKRLYKNDQISFDLQELCYEKLGISRNLKYPSLLKQALESALKEHIEKKLLSSAIFRKTKKDGRWILTIKKYKEEPALPPVEETLPAIEEQSTSSTCSLINQLVSLDVAKNVAIGLVNRIDSEIIENQIEALPLRNNIDNKPAFLVKAIMEDYPLPEAFKKKLSAKEYEKEAKLKEKYHDFIIDQVDIHLQKCDKAVIEREIEEFKPLFMQHWSLDDIAMQASLWRAQLEHDYKIHQKAKTLNIPSFEDWKAQLK